MELTEREQIQLQYLAEHTKQTRADYKRAYLYSRETSFSKATLESLDAMIDHFRKRKEVQQFVEDATRESRAEIIRKVKAEVERLNEGNEESQKSQKSQNGNRGNGQTFDTSGLRTNFEDRTQFIQYLNERANTIADEAQRIQILKMLADLLRLKEDAPNEENDIQRFYVPLKCSNCVLYRDNIKGDRGEV